MCELCREHPWRGPGGSPTSWPAPPRKAAHHRESTVHRILRRRGLIEPGRRRPKTRRVVVTSGAAADGVGKVAIKSNDAMGPASCVARSLLRLIQGSGELNELLPITHLGAVECGT